MKTLLRAIALITSLALTASATADVLETRKGRAVEGTFRGATDQMIHFEVGGTLQAFPVAEVRALRFGGTSARTAAQGAAAAAVMQPPQTAGTPQTAAAQPPQTAGAAPTAASQPPQAAAPAVAEPRTLSVPAGTRLRVRLADSLDVRHSAVDDRFAGMLEAPLTIEGVTVAPAGSRVYGKVAEAKMAGPMGSQIKLELTELMISGQTLEILTGTHQLVEAGAATADPAKAAPAAEAPPVASDRIPGGAILEFRLLQPFQVGLR
jgi:hypothetical protein